MTADRPLDASADYRPVSSLAVAALAVGCCSAVALVTRFAWVVPLIGTAVAIAAVADLARPDVRKAGRAAALAGLALSIGFGCQAVAGWLTDRWIMESRARAAAGAWIDAVREGRTAEALGLCGPSMLPTPPSGPSGEAAEGDDARLGRFSDLAAVKAVAACGGVRPTITRATAAGTDDGAWTLTADLGACGGVGTTLTVAVVPARVRGTQGTVERWSIVMAGLDR